MLELPLDSWGTILEAVATYCGIGSAYLFARPALKRQDLQANLLLFETTRSDNPDVEQLREAAIDETKRRLSELGSHERRDNFRALGLLVISALIFFAAVTVHFIANIRIEHALARLAH